jgi:hypothetical protein
VSKQQGHKHICLGLWEQGLSQAAAGQTRQSTFHWQDDARGAASPYGSNQGGADGAMYACSPTVTSASLQYNSMRCLHLLLQVETKECLEAIDDVLSVPGINVAFLGAWLGSNFCVAPLLLLSGMLMGVVACL